MDTQVLIVKKFQRLAANKGLFSHIVNQCPYPVAVFTREGELVMSNRTLCAEAGLEENYFYNTEIRIFHHVGIHNASLLEAARQVFAGKTIFLDNLKNPLSLFFPERQTPVTTSDAYKRAVFFPVWYGGGKVRHGVAIFLNHTSEA